MRPDERVEFALDSNLAVLFVVGVADRSAVSRHKRLAPRFSIEDFDILRHALEGAARVVVPPHVLTETSNLARQGAAADARNLAEAFRFVVESFDEVEVEARQAVGVDDFQRLGLTDCVLLVLGSRGATLLTVDEALYCAALSKGYDAVNFADLRAFGASRR